MIENFIADDTDHVERLPGSHRVDQHVPVDADEVFGVEDAVFVLKGKRGLVNGTSGDRVLLQQADLRERERKRRRSAGLDYE